MKIALPIAVALLGAWLLPITGYAAATPAIPSSAEDTATFKVPKDRHGAASVRSEHPVDDSLITTKIKAKFVKDKSIRADNVEVKTLNGDVELFGTARTKEKARHAVALARQVPGVRSVKNEIRIGTTDSAEARDVRPDPNRTADTRRSDQPVDDTWITTKVKSKMVKDKSVHASTISVKTVNGVVELTGTARSRSEASRAASLARSVKGVQSVSNDIEVSKK